MPVDREKLRLSLVEYTCSQRCMGHEGNKGGCCTLADRDWIIGPIDDADAFLERLSARLGRPVSRAEALIDAEEGLALFPALTTWQSEAHFPAMRVDVSDPRRPCVYFDASSGGCTVYDIRPDVCRRWHCEHLGRVLSLV